MKEILKLFIEYQKQKRQTKKDLRRLADTELDYEALQQLVDSVKAGESEVRIVVNLANGRVVTIERTHDTDKTKSFQQRFIEARANKGV